MRNEYLKHREELYFKCAVKDYVAAVDELAGRYAQELANADSMRRAEIGWILEGLAIDARSYIPEYVLRQTGTGLEEALQAGYSRITGFLRDNGLGKNADAADKEAWNLANSNLLHLARLNSQQMLNTPFGTDCAWGIIEASRYGAQIQTLNPVMCNNYRKNEPELWDPVRDRIAREFPNASDQELVTRLSTEIVLYNCRVLKPIFDVTDQRVGYVHMQVNPHHANDSVKMAEEAEFVYRELEKALGGTPNVIFKIPAVKEGLDAAKRLVEQGICVTITANASISQHKAFAEAMANSRAKLATLVVMAGRFDDPIIEELKAAGVEPDEAVRIGRSASTALLNRCYDLLRNRMKCDRVWLLVASMRVPSNIEALFNADVECPVYLSIFPPQAEEYESMPRRIVPGLGNPVPQEDMEKLRLSDIFNKGYDYDALSPDEFADYIVVSATMDQFKQNYDETVEYMRAGEAEEDGAYQLSPA